MSKDGQRSKLVCFVTIMRTCVHKLHTAVSISLLSHNLKFGISELKFKKSKSYFDLTCYEYAELFFLSMTNKNIKPFITFVRSCAKKLIGI